MSESGISQENYDHIEDIRAQLLTVLEELYAVARLEQGDILVIGCSSSEVAGSRIGTYSSEEIGRCLFQTAYGFCRERGIYLACQCCEHLNRSLIVEKACMKEYRLTRVNVVPQLKAGGSFATAAYHNMQEPVAVEQLKARAGIDIGDTLIGMHLEAVAVPVRTSQRTIGQAHVVCARTRAKYVGGSRAAYDENLSN
ncbi:MAG: TIGR01440 family protein [Lachnospiraceae bacterium]|nr:TIGR01440 family protein [Lachnospiraceae bacterium]